MTKARTNYKLVIDGQIIEAKRFTTLSAAQNFISKKDGRKVVFFKAYEYYVNIN